MTVETLETAKRVVGEIGPGKVHSVFSYEHSATGKTLYAVFTHDILVDIYQSPFCRNPKLLFEGGEWL